MRVPLEAVRRRHDPLAEPLRAWRLMMYRWEEGQLVAAAVSRANRSRYCVARHRSRAIAQLSEEQVGQALGGADRGSLPPMRRALLEFAEQLTLAPAEMSYENVGRAIDAAKSVGEIQQLLARHGAARVMVEYDATGTPSGLAFELKTSTGVRGFRLPAKIDGVLGALERQAGKGRVTKSMVNRTHAGRVAWRILKDWLEAQLALVQADLVELDEVMLAYMLRSDDKTMYQFVREQLGQLPAPPE
jgi:AhpD family alkylhydroperoxidase